MKVFGVTFYFIIKTILCSIVLEKRKNVLLIIVDDLRPTIRALGDDKVISPNMDKLAENGIVYNNAHAQV